jgi:hypothetical protein
MEKLFHKKLVLNSQELEYNKSMIKQLLGMVLKLNRKWNYDSQHEFDSSRLLYHIGKIANDVDWSDEEDVKAYSVGVLKKFKDQVVPLDLQFRMSKVIIILINVLAKNGDQAWHAVFNPDDRKQLTAMSKRMHDVLIKDILKPFYDTNGKKLFGKG